jgi:nitrogen fixation protein NifU and related proteins
LTDDAPPAGRPDPARALYHATILERDRNPRCCGPLPGATHQATLDNPLCGDVITMRLVVADALSAAGLAAAGEPRIRTAAFEGRGCAVSRASASLWAELIQERSPAEVAALVERFLAFVAEPADAPLPPELGELVVLAGVRAVRSRRICATLAARAVAAALATSPPETAR